MKLLFSCLLAIWCFSCNNTQKDPPGPREVPAGGPCSYKHDTLPARVVKINRQPNSMPGVYFEVRYSETHSDTVSYNTTNKRDISEEEITKSGIKPGAVFRYIVSEITSGSCNPRVTQLLLEPYLLK